MITIKCSLHSNLGDRPTNEFLGTAISKEPVNLVTWTSIEPSYMMCGSLLQFARENNIIWGSGFMYRNDNVKAKPKQIYAVRGKLSRNRLLELGISCPEVYGDPALFYPRFYNPSVKKQYKLGIIAHYIDQNNENLRHFTHPDVLGIDILAGYEQVITQMLSCERIASSALHGLIVADAYHIPSLWIKFSDKVLGNGFKFLDYFSAVNRKETAPITITNSTTIQKLLTHFTDSKIEIDLQRLYQSCPFRK